MEGQTVAIARPIQALPNPQQFLPFARRYSRRPPTVSMAVELTADGVRKVLQKKAGHGKRLEVTKQPTMKRTTTQKKITPGLKEIKELMAGEEDFLRPSVGLIVQEILEAEMNEEPA